MRYKVLLYLTIIISILIFSPALNNFFWGDDWYHLSVSQITTSREFFNFFSFQHTNQSIPFYRPISTQLFFYSFSNIFWLNAFPYYLFLLLVFGYSLYLLNKLVLLITNDKKIALLATFIYGLSATNFPRLYYISNLQEILMVVFVLLSLINYLQHSPKKTILSVIFFILALGSKETAIIMPAILFIFNYLNKKFSFVRLWPFFLIALLYIFIRIIFWNNFGKDNYAIDLSPFRTVNTLGWYTFWSFGVPEFLVDYVASGFKILSRYYQDFQFIGYVLLTLIGLTFLSFGSVLVVTFKKIDKADLFFASVFLIGLAPVIFLPWHKFAYELTLPMVGFSALLANLLCKKKIQALSTFFIIMFCILNLFTVFLDYQRHQSVTRSKISHAVFDYFSKNYPTPPQNSYFEFINDTDIPNENWGSSKQIDQAISGSNLFKVFYNNPNYVVYYEDIVAQRPVGQKRIPISTEMFLK